MKFFIILLLFTQFGIAQTNETTRLQEGNKAFLENDFVTAKKIFKEITDNNPNSKDGWYNLAASELNLNENESACEHFYKVYLIGDYNVLEDIKEFCPNFRNGTIMFRDEVEEVPKFIYKEKEYNLFEKKVINPLYVKILTTEIEKSKFVKNKLLSNIYITIKVNTNNSFDGKIVRYGIERKFEEQVRLEVMTILKNCVTYKSAKNKGVNVDIWDALILPIKFNYTNK